ncbi:MAG: metallophosphoesterase [Sphingobacterium sp.]
MENEPKVFVMGDIHGAYTALIQCLKKSQFDYEKDTLIQLGDVVDGNPQVFECIEELLKIKNLIAIRGNHDAWFQEFLETDHHPYSWNHGGINTLNSYLSHCKPDGKIIKTSKGYKTSINASDIPESHKNFFKNQKLYYIDEQNRCFVHAGFDRKKSFFDQEEYKYYMDRGFWINAMRLNCKNSRNRNPTDFRHIFIGHTPTTRWDITIPITTFEITNLDTGASQQGKLTILELQSFQTWQSDFIM